MAGLAILAACSRGGGDSNLGVASGNTLSPQQIDSALGPASQQIQALGNSTADENMLAAAQNAAADTNEGTGNDSRLLRQHRAGNAEE